MITGISQKENFKIKHLVFENGQFPKINYNSFKFFFSNNQEKETYRKYYKRKDPYILIMIEYSKKDNLPKRASVISYNKNLTKYVLRNLIN